MKKSIIANVMPEETRVALLEDGELMEISVERSESGHLVGNIYKGKVKNVLPGMQAAFVDIGRDKNAFLYMGDAGRQAACQHLTVGQDILVQIAKDAMGEKGPRATISLTLPGRYIVLMPTVDYIGISRRIEDETERERLRQLAEKIRPAGMGVIVRTVAAGKSQDELVNDMAYLTNMWSTLSARVKRINAPALIYRDADLVVRIVRDYLTNDVTEFVIDSQEAYNRVVDLLKYTSPELVGCVRLYEQTAGPDGDMFSRFNIDTKLESLRNRRVDLACGGYLVIDYTEALTVIDVNTGKFIGNTNLSETVFQTNLEATAEIARQLRLRDIGGIIIIDFIDMAKAEQRAAVLNALELELKKDRTKSNVLGITNLGLVEMTRKKARQNINGMLYGQCPCCLGRGRIKSPETVVIDIKRELRKLNKRPRTGGRLLIQVHPQVAEFLNRQGELKRLEQETARTLGVEAAPTMNPEMFSLLWKPD
ncbi:Rne/Rng family ribonuclease [Sporomusa sp.]|uniref:Rne/Rng family ribonuclease n=1 Tax=Sporomusa sp. TaxID=2078658 RepID=UPI002C52338A|nr:Rne/Rng family ribonuclease [Sporomusa sp.]HWR41574.1 Rne/Rng family ribonuclease [Sporomusa sp.]